MQKLPNPPLVPTSQSSGGEVHSNALAMTAPGSRPVTPPPAPDLVLDVNGLPDPSGPAVVVSDESSRVRGDDGRFTDDGGGWMQAGSDAGGWHRV